MPRTRHHMCQSVTGPLKNWSGKQWNDATDWITRDDGTKFANGEELEFHFQEMADRGIHVIPIGDDCEGFDPVKGCPGHPLPDLIPDQK